MKSQPVYCLILVAVFSFAAGCSNLLDVGNVVINLDLSKAAARSVSSRPLTLPESILITVEGPGMTPMEQTYTPDTTRVNLTVRAGLSRTVTITLNMPPDDPGAVLVFRDSATLDLVAGSSQTLYLRVLPVETKILVPDMLNYRIVQLDNMSGAWWVTRTQSDFSSLMTFQPTDIDLDSQGRIYFTNNASAYGSVYRIDDMTATNAELFNIASHGPGIPAIAVDAERDWVYYITSSPWTLRRVKTDKTGDTLLSTTGITLTNTVGIDVDTEGYLYFYGVYDGQLSVIKYNPATMLIVASATVASLGLTSPQVFTLSDVMVKDGYAYVATYYAGTGFSQNTYQSKTVKLDSQSLSLAGTYGFGPFTGAVPGAAEIPGARRFLAIRNKKFYLTDEWCQANNDMNRIIAFDGFSDTTFDLYGASGSGIGQFSLMNSYFC